MSTFDSGLSVSLEMTRERVSELSTRLESEKETLRNIEHELKSCARKRWRKRVMLWYVETARMLRLSVDSILGWRWAGVLIGATVMGALSFMATFALGATISGVVISALLVSLVLYVPPDPRLNANALLLQTNAMELVDRQTMLRAQTSQLVKGISESEQEHRRWSTQLRDLELKQSQRYRREQLLRRDWKSLRSVPFENFLEEVFQELGFVVETTRVTGDQGADLLVAKGGRRIVIQVKGYFNSVSNGAVQEAFSAKAYYNCDTCAVITNSRFTSSAKDLAARIGCVLIDEETLASVILGEHDPWRA